MTIVIHHKHHLSGGCGSKYRKNKFSTWKLFCFFLRFHFFTSPSRFATSSCFDHESQAGPLNVRRRMRLGTHCRAPPLAVQPSPAPTIRHGGEARRVGAGARRWADLQASMASTGPVCGRTNPGGRGENPASPLHQQHQKQQQVVAVETKQAVSIL